MQHVIAMCIITEASKRPRQNKAATLAIKLTFGHLLQGHICGQLSIVATSYYVKTVKIQTQTHTYLK